MANVPGDALKAFNAIAGDFAGGLSPALSGKRDDALKSGGAVFDNLYKKSLQNSSDFLSDFGATVTRNTPAAQAPPATVALYPSGVPLLWVLGGLVALWMVSRA